MDYRSGIKINNRIAAVKNLLGLLLAIFLLASCQKEIDGSIDPTVVTPPPTPTNQKPKVGTTWTYRYYTYYGYGGLATSDILTLTAKNELLFGGDKYLNIVDKATDTTVFLLTEKTDGLYHFDKAAGMASLLCKAPALVNDTYISSILGSPETFVVKGVKDSLQTGLGTIATNYYEGSKGGKIFDEIWYNENAWIVLYVVYRTYPISGNYARFSTLALNSIVY